MRVVWAAVVPGHDGDHLEAEVATELPRHDREIAAIAGQRLDRAQRQARVAGGLVPLTPYILMPSMDSALRISVILTIGALFAFGWVKGRFTGVAPLKSALQTTLVGGLAAGEAFGIARAISG